MFDPIPRVSTLWPRQVCVWTGFMHWLIDSAPVIKVPVTD